MRLNPYAAFDCLSIALRLQQPRGAFAAPEVHLFAYLSCLLWLYSSNSVTDWGYDFVATELGAPFSLDLDAALKQLTDSGCIVRTEDRLMVGESAGRHLDDYSRLTINRDRLQCLDAACATLSAFSLGMVTNALGSEPELSRAQELRISRRLLEETGRAQLYEQFSTLRGCLHERTSDLRLPAVVWLTALYRSQGDTE